jgi:hypothetical protein
MESTTKTKNISPTPKLVKVKVDCVICAEEVYERKIVTCPFCKFEVCSTCIHTFLMGIDDDRPRCMENTCKKVWTYEFVSENFPPSFHNHEYRERRATLLFEREKSLLPGTQGLVARERLREKTLKDVAELLDENSMYRELIIRNNEKIRLSRLNFTQADGGEELDENGNQTMLSNKKVNFTRACPVDECRGFLSTSLKCGLCEGYACKDCHLPKSSKHDDDHICDPDLVATVKLLASDTKPCPACATPIFKIVGCDQMYCTQCHTAFSWLRGTIERGVIHNPHFYEAQRAMNNGVAPSRQTAFRCGGPPAIWEINEVLDRENIYFELASDAHRLINHINMIELPRYPNTIGDLDNSSLRIDYLLNRITEKQWISKLKNKMKKQEKDGELNMVLTMFTTTMADLFGNILESDNNDIDLSIVSMFKLREYTNNSLKKIGVRYGNIYPNISDNFTFLTNANAALNRSAIKQRALEAQRILAEQTRLIRW